MDNVASDIFRTYGIPGLAALLILAVVAWAIAHKNAEPGSKVSLLWGMVTYKKKYRRARRQKKRPTEVIHEQTNTLWRILWSTEEWIDADLSKYSLDTVDSIIAGPHCRACKTDLGYLNTSSDWNDYRVRRRCSKCDIDILPEKATDDRRDFKKYILELLQQAHLSGKKIKSGMKI